VGVLTLMSLSAERFSGTPEELVADGEGGQVFVIQ
jgi:hypothetical protein